MDTTLCATYYRISSDPKEQRLGVSRQREDCLAEAGRRGWHVLAELEDNDRSAYGGKLRPGYEQLVALIEQRQVRAVVAWAGDRLHRDMGEYLAFERLVRKYGVQVVLVRGGEWALETAAGRLSAGMLALVSQHESAQKSERINRSLQQRAEAGKPAHGRWRPFGFDLVLDAEGRVDSLTVRDDEARLIRDGVADLIAGRRSLTKIAASWGKTTTGARKILQSRRLIGQRDFQGGVYDARWPAVVSEEDWTVVQAILAGKQRPAYARRHLLSGLARCGSCGSLLRIGTVRGALTYRCMGRSDGAAQPDCPKRVQRQADRLEAHVVGRVLRELERAERSPFTAGDNAAVAAEIVRLERRLGEIEAQLDEDGASVAMLNRAYRRVEAKIAELRAEITLEPVPHGFGPADEEGWRQVVSPWRVWWDDPETTDAERRQLLAAELEAIRVFPTQHGRLPLDESAVRLDWREAS